MTAQREYELWKDYKREVEKTLKRKLGKQYGRKKGQYYLLYYFKPYSDRNRFKLIKLNRTLSDWIPIYFGIDDGIEVFRWYYSNYKKFDRLIEIIDNGNL